MTTQDSIQGFIFENLDIRGQIVHLTNSYTEILQQHPYPPVIQKLLGETLLAAVLLTGVLKFEGLLTIQFYGEGPIRLLAASCDNQFNVRGLSQFDEKVHESELEGSFGKGKLVITIAAKNLAKPYQSIIPIQHTSISDCLENYFMQSEQLFSKFKFVVTAHQASGILFQALPTTNPNMQQTIKQSAKDLYDHVSTESLLLSDNEALLLSLDAENEIRVFEHRAVQFKCSCNLEKMRQVIKMMGEVEAKSILSTNKNIEVCCEYCNAKHYFEKADVSEIFSNSLSSPLKKGE